VNSELSLTPEVYEKMKVWEKQVWEKQGAEQKPELQEKKPEVKE